MRPRQTHRHEPAPGGPLGRASAHGLSSSATAVLGDDLSRARQFARTAGGEMQTIVEASRDRAAKAGALAPGRDPAWLCERLSIIQREAKRARALAVYRSAQDALTLIQRCNVHMPIDWTRVDGRLFVLNKLLGQYATGLDELEQPETQPSETKPEEIRVDIAPVPVSEDRVFDPVHEIAKSTLSSLLPHASEQERTALSRLMDLDLSPVGESLPEEADLEDMTAGEPAEFTPETTTAETPRAECLEWIMPGLVQELMEVGRQYGKMFSVSHALDDVMIEPGTADGVRDRIHARLCDLIASNLPLQGVGRIDIKVCHEGLLLSGSGFESFELDLPERVELLDAPDHSEETPSPQPAPRMITDETEADLRAQLGALMDGALEWDTPGSSTP